MKINLGFGTKFSILSTDIKGETDYGLFGLL